MMNTLSKDWITEGLLDFEYKKYIMLAYLQGIETNFSQQMLYPSFAELVDHYNRLSRLKSSRDELFDQFPRSANPFATEDESTCPPEFTESGEMQCVQEIVEFALPYFESKIEEGKDIYEFVEKNLEVEPVGVLPLYKDEGYIMIHDEADGDVFIYQYSSSFIESSTEKYRALKTNFIGRERKTLSKSFENIKLSLAKKFSDLPNPAAWLVQSNFKFPLIETFLPVTKRVLMRELFRAT
jgi:hypothetical protein